MIVNLCINSSKTWRQHLKYGIKKMARFFFEGKDLMFRLRDGGEKIAVFFEGDFLRSMLEEDFEVNLNGWSPDEVTDTLVEEGLLPEFFRAAKKAYTKMWWDCHAAKEAGADVDAAYNAAVNALLRGDIAGGMPVYVAERSDVKKSSNNPFGNREDHGGDRWASKGINMMSHRDHVDQYEARRRVSGTDLPAGINFQNVAVVIAGQRFQIKPTSVEIEKINKMWDRESDSFLH